MNQNKANHSLVTAHLQQRMRRMGMTEEQCHSDNYLMSEDASLVIMEFGMNPIVDEERSFDIYAE
jgi:translation initiation factor IF-2